jgi:heterodisulfide reductase subunit C2
MPDVLTQQTFMDRVMAATPGGSALTTCLQCGTCGGSCPSGADMDASPRRLFAMILAGMEKEVLSSNTPWYCVGCYYCTVRCPQQIPVTDLMYTLKQMAIQEALCSKASHADFSESFLGNIEQYGRSFEFGLATRYHLTHHPLDMARKGSLGFQMIKKGRLRTTPERIRQMPQLRAILDEAKRIEMQEEV